jgi:hypothetical protein
MSTCFFKRLINWEDPNLSASFLTVGNLAVLFLTFSSDVSSWLLFLVIWGVFPLGLVARLGGFENQVTVRPAEDALANHYKEHVFGSVRNTHKLLVGGVYLIIVSELMAMFGIVGMIGIVGNAVLLGPLLWKKIKPHLNEVKRSVSVSKIRDSVGGKVGEVETKLVEVHPMALPGAVALVVFTLFYTVGEFVTSKSFVVGSLALVGYLVVIACVLVPEEGLQYFRRHLVPAPEKIDKTFHAVEANKWFNQIKAIVLWENYPKSIVAFVTLYTIYFGASFTGIIFVGAVAAASAAAYSNTPDSVKEKVNTKAGELKTQIMHLPAVQKAKSLIAGQKKNQKQDPIVEPLATERSEDVVESTTE